MLLVGGASSRFGSPKPLASFAGETLAARAWRILGEAFPHRLAVGKGDLELPFDVVVEPAEPQAPIAGVVAGLRAAPTDAAVFLPVDCPLVTPELLRELGEAGAVTQTGPLPGAYARSDLPELERRLADGRLHAPRCEPARRPGGSAPAREREHARRALSARTPPRRSRRAAGLSRWRSRAGRRG